MCHSGPKAGVGRVVYGAKSATRAVPRVWIEKHGPSLVMDRYGLTGKTEAIEKDKKQASGLPQLLSIKHLKQMNAGRVSGPTHESRCSVIDEEVKNYLETRQPGVPVPIKVFCVSIATFPALLIVAIGFIYVKNNRKMMRDLMGGLEGRAYGAGEI
ncbi:hypothetical protein BCON_0006g01120 [Botryotinia convoluta]|uniref:Uncharacterized protein n=1 Tax=Botryotinia convoluta TaxID=54673 RepID=A0A4Z1ITC0_9HELO|nr:hypothetical protein BCON_0006g01120 [Botryotinia convoluta]